jgi:hypothetical protein
MDQQRFIERILETENLTAELEDAEANWLLNWGISQLDAVLQKTSDSEVAGARVNALMAVMRKINRLTAARQNKSAEALAAELSALAELFGMAFHCTTKVDPASLPGAVTALPGLSARQAVEFLAAWGVEACKPA